MELHERLSANARPVAQLSGPDPFAEVKNRIHLAVIGELGPQLFNATMDPLALRDRAHESLQEATGKDLPAEAEAWADFLHQSGNGEATAAGDAVKHPVLDLILPASWRK